MELKSINEGHTIYRIADPWIRLAAKLINLAIMAGFAFLGAYISNIDGSQNPIWVIFSIALYLVAQIFLLVKYGQSVGKMLCGIKIVNENNGRVSDFLRVIYIRTILNGFLMAIIPFYGLVDRLSIFSEFAKSTHDRVSGTIVIEKTPVPRILTKEEYDNLNTNIPEYYYISKNEIFFEEKRSATTSKVFLYIVSIVFALVIATVLYFGLSSVKDTNLIFNQSIE